MCSTGAQGKAPHRASVSAAAINATLEYLHTVTDLADVCISELMFPKNAHKLQIFQLHCMLGAGRVGARGWNRVSGLD